MHCFVDGGSTLAADGGADLGPRGGSAAFEEDCEHERASERRAHGSAACADRAATSARGRRSRRDDADAPRLARPATARGSVSTEAVYGVEHARRLRASVRKRSRVEPKPAARLRRDAHGLVLTRGHANAVHVRRAEARRAVGARVRRGAERPFRAVGRRRTDRVGARVGRHEKCRCDDHGDRERDRATHGVLLPQRRTIE